MPGVATEGSVVGRMFNVLAAPGEVFADLKERPVRHANWVLPAILWTVIGSMAVLLLFSQDWAMAEIKRGQRKAMEAQVAAGKMTQAQMDQAMPMVEKFTAIGVKVGGTLGTMVMAFAVPFVWGFVIWFVGTRFMGGDFEYMKAVEAAGLASIIYVLASVVGVLFSFAMGKMTFISPAFFLKEFDWTSKQHFALAALNPLYLWFAAVAGVAAAKFSGGGVGKALAFVLAFWLVLRVLLIGVGLGNFVL